MFYIIVSAFIFSVILIYFSTRVKDYSDKKGKEVERLKGEINELYSRIGSTNRTVSSNRSLIDSIIELDDRKKIVDWTDKYSVRDLTEKELEVKKLEKEIKEENSNEW